MNKCETAHLPGWMLVSGIVAGAIGLTLCLGLMLWAVVDATREPEPVVDWQAGNPLDEQKGARGLPAQAPGVGPKNAGVMTLADYRRLQPGQPTAVRVRIRGYGWGEGPGFSSFTYTLAPRPGDPDCPHWNVRVPVDSVVGQRLQETVMAPGVDWRNATVVLQPDHYPVMRVFDIE